MEDYKHARGDECEDLVCQRLQSLVDQRDVRLLRNLYLPYKDRTAEIDLLLCTTRGFFCLECKAIQGTIYGTRDAWNWRCNLGDYWFVFYNPIRQNSVHLRALSEYLGEIPVFPYIVFYDGCDIRGLKASIPEYMILHYTSLVETLMLHIRALPSMLRPRQLQRLCSDLESYTHVTPEQKEQHIQKAREAILTCPMCGGRLVKRFGFSWFYGCSNFPVCHYMRPCNAIQFNM